VIPIEIKSFSIVLFIVTLNTSKKTTL